MSEFVYVPVEPTEEMLTAAYLSTGNKYYWTKSYFIEGYKAAISAALTQPSPDEFDKEAPINGASDFEIAEAIETLQWTGVPIGHKAILQSAIFALKSRTKKDI